MDIHIDPNALRWFAAGFGFGVFSIVLLVGTYYRYLK